MAAWVQRRSSSSDRATSLYLLNSHIDHLIQRPQQAWPRAKACATNSCGDCYLRLIIRSSSIHKIIGKLMRRRSGANFGRWGTFVMPRTFTYFGGRVCVR